MGVPKPRGEGKQQPNRHSYAVTWRIQKSDSAFCQITLILVIFNYCWRQTFSTASWSCPVWSSVTRDVKGKLKDWMLVSVGFFIVTIAHSLASDNCACRENNHPPSQSTTFKPWLHVKQTCCPNPATYAYLAVSNTWLHVKMSNHCPTV